MSAADHTTALYTIAELYFGLGWSVIPVQNDKVAAVAWKPYQTRRPTETNLQTWFTQKQYLGLAIVTGMISNLVVLDFDDSRLFQQFYTMYTHLAETRTVKTKRGFHLYFSPDPGVRIASRKVPGVDLQSDGRYVVAPPSVIDGYEYTIHRGGQPKTLTAQDARLIELFLDSLAPSTPEKVENAVKGRFKVIERESCEKLPQPAPKRVTPHDLVGLYRHLAPQQGRNEALFKVSLRARDDGLTLQQTVSALADPHVTQPATGSHKPETPARRHREAERTITSAFSRPPRKIEQPARPDVQQLSNSAREALFQRKQTYAVRTIEGLRLRGVQPGEWFTEAQARELLSGLVGKHSLRETLTAQVTNQTRRADANIPHKSKTASSKMLLERIAKSELSPQGRPTYLYQMPTNAELCAKLEVESTYTSDLLTEEDIQSAKSTRQAAHRELIRRRPDYYPRIWLANRLGVSISTEQRYNLEIPINVTPTYTINPIHWWSLNKIPVDLDIPGLFLQDVSGKRYPAQQTIARSLLSQGKKVMLARQGGNWYSYSDPSQAIPQQHLEQQRLL